MHEKYASQGLVCMSVSLDKAADKAAALAFLTRVKSAFPNYLLDETEEFWQARWNVNGPPIYFVFDRAGRRAGKFTGGESEEAEKLVIELLKSKP